MEYKAAVKIIHKYAKTPSCDLKDWQFKALHDAVAFILETKGHAHLMEVIRDT